MAPADVGGTGARVNTVVRRPMWLRLHRWATLLFGLPVVLIGASALPITYWNTADALFHPQLFNGGGLVMSSLGSPHTMRLSLDSLATAARRAPGVATVRTVTLVNGGRAAHAAVTRHDGTRAYVAMHPATGQILGVRSAGEGGVEWCYSLHVYLLLDRVGAPHAGQWAVLVCTVALVLLLGTGLLLWPPLLRLRQSGRDLIAVLCAPLRRGRRTWDLHVRLGLVSLAVLGIAALTTIALLVPQLIPLPASAQAATLNTESVTPPASAGSEEASPLQKHAPATIEVAAAAAVAAFPDRPLYGVYAIDDATRPYTVALGTGVGREPYLWVSVDRQRTAVLSARLFPEGTADAETRQMLIAWHRGQRFGTFGQALFAFASLAPAVLYGSGLVLLARRWQRERRTAMAT
jgi:uncharacterized iron-regulated membrane protein